MKNILFVDDERDLRIRGEITHPLEPGAGHRVCMPASSRRAESSCRIAASSYFKSKAYYAISDPRGKRRGLLDRPVRRSTRGDGR